MVLLGGGKNRRFFLQKTHAVVRQGFSVTTGFKLKANKCESSMVKVQMEDILVYLQLRKLYMKRKKAYMHCKMA